MEGNQTSELQTSTVNNNLSEESAVEDLKLLIDCIKYQNDDVSYQVQALKTMASFCHTSDDASDYLIHSDGLQYIMKILFNNTMSKSIKVECLHVLCEACENNALAQQVLCEEHVFVVLKTFLSMKSDPVLQILSAYLLICLATNNEKGQILARTTKCLEILRYLFKDVCSSSCSPSNRDRMSAGFITVNSPEKENLIHLWQTATNAMSMCVNNPQNDENQVLCSSVFPAAVAYLRNSQSSIIQATTLSFMTNCLANNNRAQISFRLIGGLRVLSDILRDELSSDSQVPSQVLKNVVLALEAAVCGNNICRDTASGMGVIPLLLHSIQLYFGTPKFKVECLIAIAACIEECAANCLAFSAAGGITIVITMLAEHQNCEELKKSATCVLHSYMQQTKSHGPGSLENMLTSKVTLDGSATASLQNNGAQPYLDYISKIAKPDDDHECSTSNTNVVEHRSECDVVNEVKDDVQKSKSLLASTTDDNQCGTVTEQIKDLTEEVQFLKEIFTNKENILSASIAKDVQQCLMDVINASCNAKVMTAPESDIGMEQLPIRNDTTTVTMNDSHRNNHTTTTSHLKESELNNYTIVSMMKESNLSSSTTSEQEKSHLGNHTNTTEMEGTTTTTDMEKSHFSADATVSDGNLSDQCSLNDQFRENNEANESTLDKLSLQPSRVQGHSKVNEISLPQFALQGSLAQSDTPAREMSCVDETDTSRSHSPTFVLLDSVNKTCDLSSEDAGDVETSYPPSTEYEDNIDETNVGNIRYGVTPDKQRTVAKNGRASKKSSALMYKQSGRSCKRTLQMPLGRKKRDDFYCLADDIIIEETSLESSSDDDDNGDEKIATKTPIKFSDISNIRSLQAKRRQKVIPSRCLGCSGDFTELNSRNFLHTLRSNRHTCSRHRDLVNQIYTALRQFKNVSESEESSPNFDFIPSPKWQARGNESPAKILKKIIKPRQTQIPFSQKEIEVLKKGYKNYGPRWTLIERNCQFRVKRTASTLKKKFKSLSKIVQKKRKVAFSSQEEKNVRQGVSNFGYSWTTIRDRYVFHHSRTPQSIKDKWRNLTKYIY